MLKELTVKLHSTIAEAETLHHQLLAKEKNLLERESAANERASTHAEKEKVLNSREGTCVLSEQQIEKLKTLDSDTQKLCDDKNSHEEAVRNFKDYEARVRGEVAQEKVNIEKAWSDVKKAKANMTEEIKKQVADLLSKMKV